MLKSRVLPGFLSFAAAAMLVGSPAHASGVALGLNVGLPAVAYAGGPVRAVSVRYGGGGGGGGRGYYRGGGDWCCGWGLGLGLGLLLAAPWVVPQTVVVQQAPALALASPPAAPLPYRPEPVIYPRNGQSAQQTDADRHECNRWATTLPAAMAEASVFQRAVEACMDGRGYTLR